MTRLRFILVACIISSLLVSPLHAATAKELLAESAAFFDKGQYQKALLKLESLDIRSDFDNSDDMKLAFKIRAISYEQVGNTKRSVDTISELYFLDPHYKFDPFDTPKSVVALAQKQKVAIDEKSKHLASKKSEAQLEQIAEKKATLSQDLTERTITIEKKPHMVTTLFPLGLNHFHLKSPVKGGIYFSLQAVGLVTNIAAFWWKQSYLDSFGTNRLKDQSLAGRFETAQTIQFIGLGALLVGYCVSVIDALIRFRTLPPQKIITEETTS